MEKKLEGYRIGSKERNRIPVTLPQEKKNKNLNYDGGSEDIEK